MNIVCGYKRSHEYASKLDERDGSTSDDVTKITLHSFLAGCSDIEVIF